MTFVYKDTDDLLTQVNAYVDRERDEYAAMYQAVINEGIEDKLDKMQKNLLRFLITAGLCSRKKASV